MSRTFDARYGGRCSACEERIHEGDPVRFHEDALVHDDCTTAAPRERAPQPICQKCFTELPVAGDCGVCE